MLIKQMVVGGMGVCCYVVACEETKEGLIIDAGGNEEEILAYCDRHGLTIRYIVGTHGHPDHVCGNARIKAATGAQIVLHVEDAVFFGDPQVREYFSMLGLPASPPADKVVRDGEVLTAGTVHLTVLHTPGHTPGGICLYSAPHLFSGDTLFAGGVGRTDFPGGDTRQLMESIKQKILTLPADTVVWPGHGYGGSRSTIGDEARNNPFLVGGW
jgi:glyoxylase-like metal-dependent hydrolase (beta-lactamase superfamily II)